MLTSDYDYELPRELIAQHPHAVREAARMLVLDRATDTREHRIFFDLPEYLRASFGPAVDTTGAGDTFNGVLAA